jgi:invasion protein IalB
VKPQIVLNKPGVAAIELAWQRCTPGACFASGPIADSALAAMAAEAEPGRINFKDAAKRDTALPLSFRGLSQALDALGREAILLFIEREFVYQRRRLKSPPRYQSCTVAVS